MVNFFARALDALALYFDRSSLEDHPGQARVVLCLPSTEDFNAPADNRVLDLINARLAGISECEEREQSFGLDKYYLYGESLEALIAPLTELVRSELQMSGAYLLCTDIGHEAVDVRLDLEQ